MISQTGTLGVNAAFLQEVKDDNTHLHELLDAAAQSLAGRHVARIRPAALVALLGRLRDQLATHFSLEEFFGYFDDAIDVAPRLSVRADELQSQHEVLFLDICGIVEDAERLLYRESPFAGLSQIALRFQAFYKKLQEHESDERDLIAESIYRDIGAAD